MFGFGKKDPAAKLKKQYQEILAQAQQRQRNGDIEGYSRLSQQAEEILKQIDAIEGSA